MEWSSAAESSADITGTTCTFSFPYRGQKLGLAVSDVRGGGVQVEKLDPASPAAGSLQIGDYIICVNDVKIDSAGTLIGIIKRRPSELRFVIATKNADDGKTGVSVPLVSMEKFEYYTIDMVRQPNESLGIGVANKVVGGYTTVVITKITSRSVMKNKLQVMDSILAINGTPVVDKQEVAKLVGNHTKLKLAMARRKVGAVERDRSSSVDPSETSSQESDRTERPPMFEVMNIAIHRDEGQKYGMKLVSFDGNVIVSEVIKGASADKKLRECDRVLEIGGKIPENRKQAAQAIAACASDLQLRIERPINPDLYAHYKRIIEKEKARRAAKYEQQQSASTSLKTAKRPSRSSEALRPPKGGDDDLQQSTASGKTM